MASATFVDYSQQTPITAAWLNAINAFVYGSNGNNALTSPVAWVRFNGTTGTILQSYGVNTVIRNSVGSYTVQYTQTLAQAANCYQIATNILGMSSQVSETTNSVTIQTANASSVLTDPTVVTVVVFGAYTPPF